MQKIRTYAKYLLSVGSFNAKKIEEVKDRSLENPDIPKNAYGIQFYEQPEIIAEDGILVGKEQNFSKITYFGDTIYSLEEFGEKFPEFKPLIPKWKEDGWIKVVITRCGNARFLEEGDKVLFTS